MNASPPAVDGHPAPTPRLELVRRISVSGDRTLGLSAAARARIAAVVFWGNLVCQIGIIVSGGVVRLTSSGLGCSTWPNCEPGQFTPELTMEAGIHPFIEFGNRTLTGVLGVFAVAVLLVSLLWLRHKGRSLLWLSLVPLIGTAVQALVGMVVVYADLHPGVVSPHFLISPILVAISTVLLFRLYDGDAARRRSLVPGAMHWMSGALAVIGFAILVLGTLVTGTGPHSGDDVHPERLPFDARTISWLHADSVMLFCGLLVGLLIAMYLIGSPRQTRRAAWSLVVVTALQAIIGYTQYFTGLPEVLVGLHMLGAGLLAAGIAWVAVSLYTWQGTETVARATGPATGTERPAPPAATGKASR
ncbi:protein required for cytochrome oxidase assembly [Brachybacterium sp. P6-10-X1]|uniref:COX15/CtaA family protein n=1 Tax=Brachybacterium sp. P6-10-X1 TaxID=1903186 RepID=UPI0009718BBD|nr:COX15/CtaA family protein [Brachybacterium sp. P6-10-X1]APX31650.1 protein required for cytochrome oxidase assembly [Brachybacterium sp. P6-10-X1]